MTDFLQNLGTIGCLGAEREAFATQLSATHTTRKSHVFAGTWNGQLFAATELPPLQPGLKQGPEGDGKHGDVHFNKEHTWQSLRSRYEFPTVMAE